MADPILNEINLTTYKYIYPNVIEDNFFLDTPFQAHLRAKALVPFSGGSHTQHVFRYAPMIGGSYQRGDNFNITKRQTLGGTVFEPRFYQVSVPQFLEDLELNRGASAVFKLIDEDLRNAMDTISVITALAIQRHGQNVNGQDRTAEINGWAEALNDGVTNSWDGNIFPTYGGATRNGNVGDTMNSVPLWAGTSTGATAPLTYNTMAESYLDCTRGRQSPNLGVTTKAGMASILERIQPQQRFTQEQDPYFGAQGIKFNKAIIMHDDYFPSARYGKNTDTGDYRSGSFTSAASGLAPTSNMPANTVLTVGELFTWFNTDKWLFRVSDSKEFGFGWSGFKPAQDTTTVVGQIKANVNLECTAPWANKQIFGIGL